MGIFHSISQSRDTFALLYNHRQKMVWVTYL